MSGGSRSLPDRPSLRYLKLAAKRRLAAGEFATLHDAQTAVAREHGLPSWAALKQACALRSEQESHALDQLRWVISRFSGADAPGWTAPEQDELREHFDDRLLAVVPVGNLVAQITKMAADLREELVVIRATPLEAVVQLAGLRYYAMVDAAPPHRLFGLRGVPFGDRITDPRVKVPPPARTSASPPARSPAWPPTLAPSWAWLPCCWPAASPAPCRGSSPWATPISTGPSPWTSATGSACPA